MKNNKIHIILIFLIVLLVIILICGRQLCNLINSNDTAKDEGYYIQSLIGTWHETPEVGAGYGDLYKFSSDGTFTFSYSQFNSEKREEKSSHLMLKIGGVHFYSLHKIENL